jgi:hypothetical protein
MVDATLIRTAPGFGLDPRKPWAAQIILIIGSVRIAGVIFPKMGDSGGWRLSRSSVGAQKRFFDMVSEQARCNVRFAGNCAERFVN